MLHVPGTIRTVWYRNTVDRICTHTSHAESILPKTNSFAFRTLPRQFSSSIDSQNVQVERDLRYSSQHPRNVLDMYSPKQKEQNVPTLLFVHGGMWLRGSKEQKPLSLYNVVSHVASQAYNGFDSTTNQDMFSNIGLTVAQHGGVACVMNYRLAHGQEETRHPHQVMDVARAIAFLISRSSMPLHLYVGGHSAGAHLAALVLCDSQFLRKAVEEYGLEYKEVARTLRGFIGISGVYNLRRLAMSPLAKITIGPAFFEHEDVTMEASPVHVLLQAHASVSVSEGLPSLATLPLLLLNAESDFHLRQDTCELEIALDQFSVTVERQSVVVSNRNHLSIIGEFGQGLMSRGGMTDEPLPDQESWSLAYLLRKSQAAVSTASTYATPFFVTDSAEPPDEASSRVLKFMTLKV